MNTQRLKNKLNEILESELKEGRIKRMIQEIIFGYDFIHDYNWIVDISEIIKYYLPEQTEEIDKILNEQDEQNHNQ